MRRHRFTLCTLTLRYTERKSNRRKPENAKLPQNTGTLKIYRFHFQTISEKNHIAVR